MKIINCIDPFPFIAIENTFTKKELSLIWDELKFLYYGEKFNPPEKTGSAYETVDGEKIYKKNNSGVWISDIYAELEYSNIHKVNRKLIDKKEEIYHKHPNWFYKNLYYNENTTLVSYYENGNYYHPHTDNSLITCLTWFFDEPKKFKGGNLVFNDYNLEIEILNNSTIIFPSCITHSVTKISMEKNICNKLKGRICMTQFLGLKLI